MTDEIPLKKPTPHHSKLKLAPRINSEGYKLNEIDPEKKRNIPSNVEETKEKEEKTGLNLKATPFIPKKNLFNQPEQNNQHYYNDLQYFNNNNFYYENNYYPNYQITNNNNISYQGQPFNFNAYYNNTHNIPMSTNQMALQPPYNYNLARNQNMLSQSQTFRKNFNQNGYISNKSFRNYQNNNTSTSTTNSLPQTISQSKLMSSGQKSSLNVENANTPFIPKNKKLELSLQAADYIPQNETLKKKEELIRKKNEANQNYNTPKKEDINIKEKEKEKETEKDKKTEKNETLNESKKIETQSKPKEKQNKVEKDNDQNKKLSGLKALLLSDNSKQESKKGNKEKVKKIENQEYEKRNKRQNSNDKRIDEFNKKKKEVDEKIKKEEEKEKLQKLEEEKRRKEEEKERKKREAEEKKRKEEELKKQLELEEKRKEEEERKKKEEELRKEEERKRKEEEERKRKEEEEKNKVIEKKYFIVFKNKKNENKEYKYTFEYIMQFKKWKISNEEELLTDGVKKHLEKFKEVEKDEAKQKKRDNQKNNYYKQKNNGPNYTRIQTTKEESNSNPSNPPTTEVGLESWARKDMTKEIKAAEEFKTKLEETIKDDPIKRNIRNYLNMLTKDNYEETKKKILDIIKDNVDYQYKFLDVLFQKAVFEKAYVEIYARLIKELDKELPQKSQSKEQKEGEKKQKPKSEMRKRLLDKCKEIFVIEKNEKFDEHIKAKDPEEREAKLKNFILGNVNFITELIKIKILSKKIAPPCINDLFKRYEKEKDDIKLKLINIEAIVIFTDQFATLVHSQEKKIATEEAKKYKESIDEIFRKLEKLKDEKDFPGYIRFKIINLIEKRKNNYQISKLEEYRKAKSRREVEQEIENEGQITQEIINDKIKKGLNDYKEFVEEEGTSEKYPWKETTYLYDKKEKSLDDILEGYIASCVDFIEKESNIKYAKDYIKELIEYYGDKIHKKEKKELKNRLLSLFEIVRNYAIDIPKIYEIYSYIIYIFLDNNIMEISDLEEIINEKDAIEDDYKDISNIFKMAYDYYKEENFKEELSKFNFIKNNSKLFEWIYHNDEE